MVLETESVLRSPEPTTLPSHSPNLSRPARIASAFGAQNVS